VAMGSWPPRASAALTITTAVLWFQAPTASHMEGGSRI
jgi:hypothetical protein